MVTIDVTGPPASSTDAVPVPRSGWWRRVLRRPRSAPDEVLDEGTRIAEHLRDGLAGASATIAARRLRGLLDVRAVGLCDLTGEIVWSDRSAGRNRHAVGLAERAARGDTISGRAGLRAACVHVRGQRVGAVVLDGEMSAATTRRVARWLGTALERARLEESADAAELAELRAMRAQMSPHFVYNALTTIASFVETDSDQAHELLLEFADYTRHSLGRHGDYTTVEGEFRAVEAYLALARAQLGQRLRVHVRIAPEILGVTVPYLALQPLVENAVQHGVAASRGPGSVRLCGRAEGAECLITVEDDGPGMDPEFARALLGGRGGDGVGLVNVDRRMRSTYSDRFGLVIETAPDSGTRVTLRFPRFHPGVLAR